MNNKINGQCRVSSIPVSPATTSGVVPVAKGVAHQVGQVGAVLVPVLMPILGTVSGMGWGMPVMGIVRRRMPVVGRGRTSVLVLVVGGALAAASRGSSRRRRRRGLEQK